MKRAIIFVISLLVIVYAVVAVLLLDFNFIGTANASANGRTFDADTRNVQAKNESA